MKKLLLTIIMSLALSGTVLAQYESHWLDFVNTGWDDHGDITAAIAIDGHVFTVEDNGWDALEIAFFVGEECRGNLNFLDREWVDEFGDPYPITPGRPIFYREIKDEVVTFKLYDHINQIEYDICEVTYLGEPLEIVTGTDYLYAWNNDPPYDPVILNFISPSLDLTVEPYTQTGGYYLIAPPFGDVDPDNVTNMIPTSGGYDLFYFDQTKENEWINYKEGDNSTNPGFSLEPGKGYLYARQEGATLTFTGTAYSGDGTFDLVYSTTNSDPIMHGWNLMGNPFATTATVNRDCYVMGEGGSEIILSENRSVEAMQGVFVKALATETEPKVTFGQGNSTGDGAKVVLNVRKDRAATIDRAMVRFNDNSSLPKFMLDNSNTKIYIPQNGDQYAVVSGGNESSLPVNFKAKENGTYTLNIDVENVDMDYLHLIDHKTGDDVDLLVNPNYTFQARSTDYAERFTLVYANTTGLEENFAFFNGSKWVIGNEGKATLQIMDVVGRLLSSEQINGSTEVSLGQPAGVYVMRLINGDNVKTQKVVVR